MRCFVVLLFVFLLFTSPIRAADNFASIEIDSQQLAQGEIGVITVTGENIVRVRAAFLDNQYIFPQNSDGEFTGLIGVPIAADRKFHRLSILVFYADGSQEYFPYQIQVIRGSFQRSTIYLPARLNNLLDEDVIYDEIALVSAEIKKMSEGALWLESGLTPPFFKTPSDGFGTIRYFNGENMQRHNGIDYPATIGTPVTVAVDGIVVLSQMLPIRGEYILVDHGSGLFSGYGHLSERLVKVGDMVKMGDVIGSTGNTGRSTGPHLHWEVAIGGVWVHPLELTALLAQ